MELLIMKDYIQYRQSQIWKNRIIDGVLLIAAIGLWSAFFIGIGLIIGCVL